MIDHIDLDQALSEMDMWTEGGQIMHDDLLFNLSQTLEPYGVHVSLHKHKNFRKNDITTAGCFIEENFPVGLDIGMDVIVSDKHDSIRFTEDRKEKFFLSVIQTVTHESIHRDQFEKYKHPRKYKFSARDLLYMSEEERSNLEYYGSPDEIEAFAHDFALEVLYQEHGPYKTFDLYKKLFGGEHHPVVQKMRDMGSAIYEKYCDDVEYAPDH